MLRQAERLAGPAAWPIVQRIVIEGGGVRDCRARIAEVTTTWRADAIVTDRLRVALDSLGELLGVTAARRSRPPAGPPPDPDRPRPAEDARPAPARPI